MDFHGDFRKLPTYVIEVFFKILVYMKMENNPLLLKTFTVNNQLDLDFYIRGRHEGADNSLCKSRPVMLIHALTGISS